MSDYDDIWIIIQIGIVIFGLILIISGLFDLSSASSIEALIHDFLGVLSKGSVGSIKIIIGLFLVAIIMAPNAVKLIIEKIF